MNGLVFVVTLFAFCIICYYIGRKNSQGNADLDSYFLGSRNFGVFSITLTILATQIGGGCLLGACDEAYQTGWGVLLYPVGMSLGLIILAIGWGGKLRRLKINTISQVFEKVYKTRNLRKFSSILSSLALFGILLAQNVATKKFFHSLGFTNDLIFYLFTICVICYTAFGGFKAVVQTDVVQIIFLLVIFFGVFFFVKFSHSIPTTQTAPSIWKSGSVSSISLFLLPLLSMLMEQDMAQRCFSARTSKVASYSCWIAALILLGTSSVSVYFGVALNALGVDVDPSSGALMTFAQTIMNPVFQALFACAILLAIVSTADSLLCSIASNFVFDFLRRFHNKKAIRLSSIIVISLGVTSTLIVSFCENLIPLLMTSYELIVVTFFPSISMAIFKKNLSTRSAVASVVTGVCCFVLFKIIRPPVPSELVSLMCSYGAFFLFREKAAESLEVAT